MATKYDIQIVSPAGDFASTAVRARKDAAIKFGDSLGESYRVVTDSGKVVHEVVVDEETVEEDLIGEMPAEDAPEPEKAEDDVPAAGEGTPGTKFDVAKMKKKISLLLAKAEGTDNEEEREAFTAKAETLMLRLGIQVAELEAAGEVKSEEIIEAQHVFSGIYAVTFVAFTTGLAYGYGNLTTLQSKRGQRKRVVFVIGHKTDVQQFMALLLSLELQAMTALKRFQRENAADREALTTQEKFVTDRSFLEGFAGEVSRRLKALRVETETEATPGAALVLASKQDKVDDYVGQQYPNLKKARGGSQQYSSHGYSAGATEGRKASLGEKAVGGKKGELA